MLNLVWMMPIRDWPLFPSGQGPMCKICEASAPLDAETRRAAAGVGLSEREDPKRDLASELSLYPAENGDEHYALFPVQQAP